MRVHALFVSFGQIRPSFHKSIAKSKHVLQFITVVAVDKRFSLLNDETTGIILGTRAQSTSTPSRKSELVYSDFLRQEGSLSFGHDKDYYSQLLEEDDDAILRWYPMYVSYSRKERTLKLNEALMANGYRTYLYLQEAPKDAFGNPVEDTLLGPIYNMVFVHAMKIQLKLLKRYASNCNIMKFMTERQHFIAETTRVIWVPDRQMENFIEASNRPDPLSQRIPLTYNEFIDKEGRAVRILSGPFTGVEGEIKRIGRHKIVVALIRDARVAVGITHVPPEHLEFI